jgi:hypothetical protein
VWKFSLRIGFSFGRPSCGRALHCVWVPILRTRLSLRWGAQIADVPCVTFGCPSCGRALRCVGVPNLGEAVLKVYLQAKICSYPSSSSSFSLVLPCVDVFVADLFCVWATILRTCLALRGGAQLADVRTCLALRTCIGAPNLRTCLPLRWGTQLADVPCVAFGHPSCGRALHCIGAPNLGEVILKSLPPSQNLFLSILQLVF